MAFPTTSILDDLNRPDAAVGASWAISIGNGWFVFSNEMGPFSGATVHGSSWGTQFTADQEVFATLKLLPSISGYIALYARLQTADDITSDRYEIRFFNVAGANNDVIEVWKTVSGVATQLGADITGFDLALDSVYGMSLIDDDIIVYEDGVELATRTDGDITGAGYIGTYNFTNSGTPRWDNFGGGNIVGGVPPVVLRRLLTRVGV